MATRKYDNEGIAKASTVMPVTRQLDEWEKTDVRRQALQVAQSLSEQGSKAEDVVADARIYYDYILEGRK